MTGLVADVAGLATAFRTVARDVSRFVAGIAALHREAARLVSALRATAGNVSGFVAVVTTHLRSLFKEIFLRYSTHFNAYAFIFSIKLCASTM